MPGVADYYYPNDQSERLVWYHDHAMGITRLNAYAGMAAGYLITDSVLSALTTGNTPAMPAAGLHHSPHHSGQGVQGSRRSVGQAGDLCYPYMYESQDPTARWDLGEPSDGFDPGDRKRSDSFVRS